MLLTGNYRCVTKDGAITIKEAVHSDLEASRRSVYNFVRDLCIKLGPRLTTWCRSRNTPPLPMWLTRPSSAARALNNGAPNIERADKLVQAIAAQKGLRTPSSMRRSHWSMPGSRPTGRRPPPNGELARIDLTFSGRQAGDRCDLRLSGGGRQHGCLSWRGWRPRRCGHLCDRWWRRGVAGER
jgi:hypothetical protein